MALYLIFLLVAAIALIVVATSIFKVHPFIVLLLAAFFVAIGVAIPQSFGWLVVEGKPVIACENIDVIVRNGFGGILAYIGIVIVLGTIIGVILEKSGAAIKMADFVLRVVGPKRPALAMSIIGWIVSIPVFCDSGYVILSSLRKSVTRKTKASAVTMSVALATGLYASHTLVPPTPGPIAAAGNLGLSDKLGYVILVGGFVSIFTMLAGYAWAKYIGSKIEIEEDVENANLGEQLGQGVDLGEKAITEKYGKLPSTFMAFAPILIPIILIAIGTVAAFPGNPLGDGFFYTLFIFLGKPVNALLIGFFIALGLLPAFNKETLTDWIGEGIKTAGPIILITAAGGAFGAVIKATPIADVLGGELATLGLGLLVPFIIAAALKTAQGSSTTALVVTSGLMAPLLVSLGLDSTMGAVLTVMAIGAGAMTVSHANDSYFWVVAQFTGMDVKTAYKTQTMATLIQGIVTLIVVLVLGFIIL